ncbi:putative ATP-dependent RNA helicase ddx28 [Dissophora globulifera]|nr:putative ATP-dependent RNA helicase ddx28 [Dissophora globulifera]
MSALQSLLRSSSRASQGLIGRHSFSFAGYSRVLLSPPTSSAIDTTIVKAHSTTGRHFSTSWVASIYAKRTPRPKQRIVKEQKLKAARSNFSAPTTRSARLDSKAPTSSNVERSKARQWQKVDTKNDRSARSSTSSSSPSSFSPSSPSSSRKRVGSTSISVTSLGKGSRNPQFEHSFAPGFASVYRARSARTGPQVTTGNAGRDKSAAAERTLIEAGAKRRSGPKVRGFVPVRFALKPITSDINSNLVSNRAIPTSIASKYKLYAQAGQVSEGSAVGRGVNAESGEAIFAKPQQETVKEMMDKVAKSRFENMGLHPDVEKGVMELLAKSATTSKATPAILTSTAESSTTPDLSFTSVKPTEIQAMTIPASIDPIKKSPYTLCAAETGSGKTLAYVVPILHQLKVQEDRAVEQYQREGGIDQEGSKIRALNTIRQFNQPRAIILLPSRELVAQVSGILKDLSHSVKLRTMAISHAMTPKSITQRLASGPVDIIVATPTSLLDYLPRDASQQRSRDPRKLHQGEEDEERRVRGSPSLYEDNGLMLSSLTHLVIDEADSMFDHGFGQDVTKIVQQAKAIVPGPDGPAKITVVSATLPKKVSDMLDQLLPGLLKITTPSLHKSLPGLHQTFLDLKPYFGNRPKAILDILAKQQQVAGSSKRKENTLVFCNTKHSCDILFEHLKTNKVPRLLGVLHGDTVNRDEILQQFTDDDYVPASATTKGGKILISTDIASRGIDTTAVNHVVLYDFPVTIVDYLHRVGRTAHQ